MEAETPVVCKVWPVPPQSSSAAGEEGAPAVWLVSWPWLWLATLPESFPDPFLLQQLGLGEARRESPVEDALKLRHLGQRC